MQNRAAERLRAQLPPLERLLMDAASTGPMGKHSMLWARIFPTDKRHVIHPWALRLFSRFRYNIPIKTLRQLGRANIFLKGRDGGHVDLHGRYLCSNMRCSPSVTMVHDRLKEELHDCLKRLPGVESIAMEHVHVLSPEKRSDIFFQLGSRAYFVDVTARNEAAQSNQRFAAPDAGGRQRARNPERMWPRKTLLDEMERVKQGEYPTLSRADTSGSLIAIAALYLGVRFSAAGSRRIDSLWRLGHHSLHGVNDLDRQRLAQRQAAWGALWRQRCTVAMVNGVSEMVFRRLEKLLLHAGIGPDEVIVADMWCGQRPGDVNGGPSKWLNEKPMLQRPWQGRRQQF